MSLYYCPYLTGETEDGGGQGAIAGLLAPTSLHRFLSSLFRHFKLKLPVNHYESLLHLMIIIYNLVGG